MLKNSSSTVVKFLNDVHGIQVRGGCSCAGTYGHYLFGIDRQRSQSIKNEIDKGHYDLQNQGGYVFPFIQR